jgi:hypothetical protein
VVLKDEIVRNVRHTNRFSADRPAPLPAVCLDPRASEKYAGVVEPPVERHRDAASTHDQAAARHEEAAERWAAQGDDEHAELERRNAEVERLAAQLERDRAALEERRAQEE